MLRVRVVNQFSDKYNRVGIADEAAWNRGDFWIPVVFGNNPCQMARMYLEPQ